jgi:hypothetical protein
MNPLDPSELLALLRDPNVESAQIAEAAAVPREEAGRAARLLLTLSRAKVEEIATLPSPLAAAVLHAAAVAGRVDLVAGLAAREEKELAKEAKRQLHRLKLRGVAIPEAPAPALTPPPEAPPQAYGSTWDGNGERAVWLPRNVPGRGLEVAQGVCSDTRGLVELHLGLVGRKEWRAFVKGLLERGASMGVAELPWGEAHARLAAARALNERSGQRVPEGADQWLGRLGAPPPLADPAAALPALDAEAERTALAASAALHDLPLLRSWLAEEPWLRAAAARLDEVEKSPVALAPAQKQERLRAVLDEAIDGYFTPERRALLSTRLVDLATTLLAAGQAESAAQAAAASRALADGVAPRQLPFATRLIEKAFKVTDSPAAATRPGTTGGAGE